MAADEPVVGAGQPKRQTKRTLKASAEKRAEYAAAKRLARATSSSALMVSIGKVIRTHRALKGMTQIGLADASDVDRVFLALIEKGRQNASVHTLERIAEAFGLRLSRLILLAENAMKIPHETAIASRRTAQQQSDEKRRSALEKRRAH